MAKPCEAQGSDLLGHHLRDGSLVRAMGLNPAMQMLEDTGLQDTSYFNRTLLGWVVAIFSPAERGRRMGGSVRKIKTPCRLPMADRETQSTAGSLHSSNYSKEMSTKQPIRSRRNSAGQLMKPLRCIPSRTLFLLYVELPAVHARRTKHSNSWAIQCSSCRVICSLLIRYSF